MNQPIKRDDSKGKLYINNQNVGNSIKGVKIINNQNGLMVNKFNNSLNQNS